MTISWTDLYTNTETVGDLALKTKLSIASVSGGYLFRAQQELVYQSYLPVMPRVAVCFVPATAPASISQSTETTATTTYTDPDDNTFDLIDELIAITPKNGGGTPIGTTQIYLSTRLVRPSGTGVSGSLDLSLEYVP